MVLEVTCKGILFDMDGTLVDSTPAVEKTMGDWCRQQGVDPDYFFHHSHGVRTRDNIKRFQNDPLGSSLSEAELDEAVNKLEFLIADNGRIIREQGGRGIMKLPGVDTLLSALRQGDAKWGIVTSATKIYATSALSTSGIVPPELPFLITADLVSHGKPHPEPYLTGLDRLRKLPESSSTNSVTSTKTNTTIIEASDVIVFEDAPSGLASGLAAGCRTLAVCTGQTRERIRGTKATFKVVDLDRVQVIKCSSESITLRLTTLDEEAAA